MYTVDQEILLTATSHDYLALLATPTTTHVFKLLSGII